MAFLVSVPALVLVFCVSQAFRDVYFGHVFQGVDFFAIILLAFLASTILFTAIPLIRDRGAFAKLRGHGRTVLMMNVTTALAWSCYFFGLSHLEPSIVNTLHSGMGPLTVVALAALRRAPRQDRPCRVVGVFRLCRHRAVARRRWRGSCCRADPDCGRRAKPWRCSASRRFSSAAPRSR